MPPEKEPSATGFSGGASLLRSPVVKLILVAAGLFLVTLAVYWQAHTFEFLNYDDPDYILNNPTVTQGVTWNGIVWAFGRHASNWHPITWITHMLDCQIYGLDPGKHHLTNVLFHAANAALLFLVFARMTGSFWRSFFIAGIFAWHPMHVESVGWISERKDVLSAFFSFLTVGCYVLYAQRAGRFAIYELRFTKSKVGEAAAAGTWAIVSYLLALVFFALALMSKPMAVTLPCVLVLLDFWPLGRTRRNGGKPHLTPALSPPSDGAERGNDMPSQEGRSSSGLPQLKSESNLSFFRGLLDKIPFFALSIAGSLMTVKAQSAVLSAMATVPMGARMANAIVSYQRYLRKAFWPSDLSMMYVQPDAWPIGYVIFSAVILIGISVWVIRQFSRRPYLLVGWLWFVGVLVPVIGLTQVGSQAMADRFSYVPMIGLSIMLVWGVSELVAGSAMGRIQSRIIGAFALVACLLATHDQLQYWRNGVLLWQKAVKVDPKNFFAYSYLASELNKRGDTLNAAQYYRAAIEINPKYARAHSNLAAILASTGDMEGANQEYVAALTASMEADPNNPEGLNQLGKMYLQQGKVDDAVAALKKAVQVKPGFAEAHRNLGEALIQTGQKEEALKECGEAARLMNDDYMAHFQFGCALGMNGKSEEAISEFRKVLAMHPEEPRAMNELAWILATDPSARLRNGTEALQLSKRACELAGQQNLSFMDTLAAAEAEAGQFNEAARVATMIRDMARSSRQMDLVSDAERRLALYQEKRAYHTAPQK